MDYGFSDSLAPCESVHMNHCRRAGSDRTIRSVVRAESLCPGESLFSASWAVALQRGLIHAAVGSGKRARGMRDERASGCCWWVRSTFALWLHWLKCWFRNAFFFFALKWLLQRHITYYCIVFIWWEIRAEGYYLFQRTSRFSGAFTLAVM